MYRHGLRVTEANAVPTCSARSHSFGREGRNRREPCCKVGGRVGLRVTEAIRLRRDDVNLDEARLWVKRLKNSRSVEHPIAGDELRAIRRYLATREDRLPWLFISERGQPLTRRARRSRGSACDVSRRAWSLPPGQFC
jgi:integrase